MLITKEQQEAWVDAYVKEKHNADQCIGFINGINKALEVVKNNLMMPNADRGCFNAGYEAGYSDCQQMDNTQEEKWNKFKAKVSTPPAPLTIEEAKDEVVCNHVFTNWMKLNSGKQLSRTCIICGLNQVINT